MVAPRHDPPLGARRAVVERSQQQQLRLRELELYHQARVMDTTSSSLLSISADWARLKHGSEDRFYSKRHVYDMRWRLEADVHMYMSAAAPCGGPVAMLRGDGTGVGARLQIFNAAGELLSAWLWECPRVLKLGWTSGHELLTVLETGRVLLWSLQGERLNDLGLGKECEQQGVLRCEVWPDSLTAISLTLTLARTMQPNPHPHPSPSPSPSPSPHPSPHPHQVWPDGLVALTHAFRLVALLSFAHPRIVPHRRP